MVAGCDNKGFPDEEARDGQLAEAVVCSNGERHGILPLPSGMIRYILVLFCLRLVSRVVCSFGVAGSIACL